MPCTECTVTTSVAASVIPKVKPIASCDARAISYAIYCAVVNVAPAGRIAALNVTLDALTLHILSVEIIALFPTGTVYNVVNVFDAGKDCPKTLNVVAMCFPYIPANMNDIGLKSDDVPPPVAVELILPFDSITILLPAIRAPTTFAEICPFAAIVIF